MPDMVHGLCEYIYEAVRRPSSTPTPALATGNGVAQSQAAGRLYGMPDLQWLQAALRMPHPPIPWNENLKANLAAIAAEHERRVMCR